MTEPDRDLSNSTVLKSAGLLSLVLWIFLSGLYMLEEPRLRGALLPLLVLVFAALPCFAVFGLFPYAALRVRERLSRSRNATSSAPQTTNVAFVLRWYWAFITLIQVCLLYWFMGLNHLPSDQEMISQLKAHQSEFDLLIEDYRQSPPSDSNQIIWSKKPQIRDLMRRLGVNQVGTTIHIWHPDPYLVAAAREFRARPASEILPMLQRRWGELTIFMKDKRYWQKQLRYPRSPIAFKAFVHVPVDARIEDGRIIFPVDTNGKSSSARVLASLDGHFPFGWRRGECIYKPVASYWYLQMCRT